MQAPTRPSPCSQGVSHLGMNAQNPWFFTGTRSAANDKRCTSEVAPGGPLQSPSGYFRDGVAVWQQEAHGGLAWLAWHLGNLDGTVVVQCTCVRLFWHRRLLLWMGRVHA